MTIAVSGIPSEPCGAPNLWINSGPYGADLIYGGGVDLSHPLATLLPSADAGALAVLAGTESPLTGRRVAELAGERSHTSTLRALNRLVEQGIVHVQEAGRAKLFSLNRDHLLTPALLDIANATSSIRGRLSAVIDGWQVACLHASLYGSVARGEAGRSSDIDLLVVRPGRLSAADREVWDGQLAELEHLVFAWTGNPLSWLDTTRTDLLRAQAAGEPIFQSWQGDAILLVGRPLAALMKSAPTRKRSA